MHKWKIIYWEKEGLGNPEIVLMIKEEELDGVILFCKMKGLRKYCIFDDKGHNVCNDGFRVVARNNAKDVSIRGIENG